MRKLVGILSLGMLAACSGGGPESAGSSAPAGSQTTAGVGTFVAPTVTKSYQAQGAVQSYGYTYNETVHYDKTASTDASTGAVTHTVDPATRTLIGSSQNPQLYFANAATVRNPGITVTYDPRNAQFTLVIAQDGVSQNATFQDPAHRTTYATAAARQAGIPNLELPGATDWRDKGVQYLQADNGSGDGTTDRITFFYELPGTTTKYVTYAGYVRTRYEAPTVTVGNDTDSEQVATLGVKTQHERAALVYGELTQNNAVPTTGTATYTGNMIASTINNPGLATDRNSYFQWIAGTATTTVDFAANSVATSLTGTVGAPLLDARPIASPTAIPDTVPKQNVAIPEGATFAATAAARIDLVGTGGFTGTFSDARFTNGASVQKVDIVGSSLDGAFYGPKADEVGASFRIVGGVPDQRVDVIGSFTGAKH